MKRWIALLAGVMLAGCGSALPSVPSPTPSPTATPTTATPSSGPSSLASSTDKAPPPIAGLDVHGADILGTTGLWALHRGEILTSLDHGLHWHEVGPWGLSSEVLDADHIWTLTAGPGSTGQNGSTSDV